MYDAMMMYGNGLNESDSIGITLIDALKLMDTEGLSVSANNNLFYILFIL